MIAIPPGTVAEQLLRLLQLRGVECFFSNSGTDFTPLIDALAKLADEPAFRLRVVAAPHENTAIAMAHGHALISRRAQVAMAHVTVGTANMGLGIINARRAHVPMLVLAGRTPWFEEGTAGVRTNFVQWGQECFDQAAFFREFTKWDYELRAGHALDTIVERALAIAQSEPAGPVYLTLPKEALCAEAPARSLSATPRQTPTRPCRPSREAIREAAEVIRHAQNPLIVTADLGRHAEGPDALVRLAERAGAGVVEHGKRNFFNFPTEHSLHLGFDPNALVRGADLVLAVECPVPWIPALAQLEESPKTIQIGVDPLFSDLPLRGFPSDISLSGSPSEILALLADEMSEPPHDRIERLTRLHDAIFGAARAQAPQTREDRITKAYLSHVIGQVIDNDVLVFNEYNLDPLLVPRRKPDSWFENSLASGLGWALGAALGAKIAAPEKTILVTVGDGAYMFNTPLSAHHVARSEGLPILIVVFNDSAWTTIKKSTHGSHPEGHAAKTGRFPLCDFTHTVAFEKVAESCGGVGVRVEKASELEEVLRRALRQVQTGDRHVLVNVICERG